MDRSSKCKYKKPSSYFKRYFTVEWEVHHFHKLLQWYEDSVLSHVIDVQCYANSSWRLGLLSSGTHLEFFLLRCTSLADELDCITVRYDVCLLDKFYETFYQERSGVLTYTKSKHVIGQCFADESPAQSKVRIHKAFLNFKDNVYEDKLRIRCEFLFTANVTEAIERNFTPDLIALSNDIRNFRENADFCDLVWHSAEADYQLNTSLLQIRLPNFRMLETCYAHLNKHIASNNGHAQCCLKTRNHSTDKPHQCFTIAVLAIVLYLVGSKTRHYPFVAPIHTPILRECFTATVCQALLSYLYSGEAHVDHSDSRLLAQIARGLSLDDLVRKLEDSPEGCYTVTETVEIASSYQIHSNFLKEWKSRNFPPYERVLTLTSKANKHKRQLSVTLLFVKSGEKSGLAKLECRFTQASLLPMLLIACIKVKNEEGKVVFNTSSKHLYNVDTIWYPDMHLEKDFPISRIECFFVAIYPYNNEVICSGIKRFKNETWQVSVKSYRQLSGDLLQRFVDQSFCDVVLIAQGKSLPAHIFVLCARSRRFRDELRSKWGKKHRITHQVPGIDYDTLVKMVRYLYSGEPDLEDAASVEKLKSAAESFGVTQLKDTCQRFLKNQKII